MAAARLAKSRRAPRLCLALGLSVGLSGCLNSLTSYTQPPPLSPVTQSRQAIDPSLPTGGFDMDRYAFRLAAAARAGQPVGHPEPTPAAHRPPARGGSPSLFRPDQAPLYRLQTGSVYSDRRARAIGDPVTVIIEISENASLNASVSRTTDSSASIGAPTLWGLESVVDRIIPGDAVGLGIGAEAEADTARTGAGSVTRDETVNVRVAALVVDVLPNGSLIIAGSQEVRVNYELRDVQIVGIVRPSDIARDNTITHDRVANARISIGGDGPSFDVTGQTYGEVLVRELRPF